MKAYMMSFKHDGKKQCCATCKEQDEHDVKTALCKWNQTTIVKSDYMSYPS